MEKVMKDKKIIKPPVCHSATAKKKIRIKYEYEMHKK